MKVRLIALALPLGGCATVSADSNKILLESGQRFVVPAEEIDRYRCRIQDYGALVCLDDRRRLTRSRKPRRRQ